MSRELALRLGDDGLILGQNLSHWCGHAPMLELDLSLANIALDLIGQAALFLGLAGDADQIAFRRDVLDFKNCLLVEQPNGDFAQTIARQFLFSNWQELMLRDLAETGEPAFAAIAAKSVKEVAYHARFASEWIVRLGDGTEESRARLAAGLDWMWRFVDELFEGDHAPLRGEWDARIDSALAEAGLERPASRRPILGGRDGHHSEHLGHLLSQMQFLQRAYPGAQW
ncbi:MAG TPA: 1,2-phenylacetyl-CoA epoxidase subunit PaaC [Rhizomicrobium sp.]|jgi:ring-1,2-phenylacetyl-CoA epoxidase subunit PaaC